MPFSPVEDLKIHPRENELIVATHGRSIWIADISYLEEVSGRMLNEDVFLFQPVNGVKWQVNSNFKSSSSNFAGESREAGISVFYYSKDEDNDVLIEVLDGERMLMETVENNKEGVNKIQWRFSKIIRKKTDQEMRQSQRMIDRYREFGMTEEQIRERTGNIEYILGEVGPGRYTVRLTSGKTVIEKEFFVLKDHWY
jgi:hypothetical protein